LSLNLEVFRSTKMLIRQVLFFTIILFFSGGYCLRSAEVPGFKKGSGISFDFWRETEGFPYSRIRSIVQTQDGYLWMASDSGAVRFNGVDFTTLNIKSGTLRENEVWALQEDASGALWIGTFTGGITRIKGKNVANFTTADGLSDGIFIQMDKDLNGNIWVVTSGGVCRFQGGHFQSVLSQAGITMLAVTALCTRSPLGILAATETAMHRLENGRFVSVPGIMKEGEGPILSMIATKDGAIWMGFETPIIKRWKDGQLTVFNQNHKVAAGNKRLYEDPRGNLWLGSPSGLSQFQEGVFEPVPATAKHPGLGNIYSLCMDREGSLWMGLQTGGLARLRATPLEMLTTEDGLPNESVFAVFQDRDLSLWIGTTAGVVQYAGGKPVKYRRPDGKAWGQVRSFVEDSTGHMWIGAGSQLFRRDGDHLAHHSAWEFNGQIRALCMDHHNRIWVGTEKNGLYQMENGIIHPVLTPDIDSNTGIRSLYVDRQGAVWIGTFGEGVIRFEEGRFSGFTTKDGLAGDRIYAIHQDEEGALWFAAREGLSRLKKGSFFTFNAEHGMLEDFVYGILDDGAGNFWFSSAQGIFKARKEDLRALAEGKTHQVDVTSFDTRDGMKVRACHVGNQPNVWKARDGKMYFCTMKGLAIVDPLQNFSNPLPPPVYVEKALINRETLPLESPLEQPVGQGEVEIRYAALSYLLPHKVQFKFKLDGFDRDWVDAGSRRVAYYMNLPPGPYRFRVLACNNDGVWNISGASLEFYLKPRFYQTRLFYTILIAAGILLGWFMNRLRTHELKARYSAVLAERNRIAQEIHDTLAQNLAGIALQLDSVSLQLTDVPNHLRNVLEQACSLTRYSLAEARRAVSDLRTDELERRELASALPDIGSRMVAGTGIQSQVNVEGTPRQLNAVAEKNLLRIFQEAMANAVKHARANVIQVDLKYKTDGLTLEVRDDGCGFDAEKVAPLSIGHYGLIGMRERVGRIGGSLTLCSKAEEGTLVRVEVPYSREVNQDK
jgi:signal transduction histidine kinase/ligand-binding sensor domain-containing protein